VKCFHLLLPTNARPTSTVQVLELVLASTALDPTGTMGYCTSTLSALLVLARASTGREHYRPLQYYCTSSTGTTCSALITMVVVVLVLVVLLALVLVPAGGLEIVVTSVVLQVVVVVHSQQSSTTSVQVQC
jgi:hypothetical protein